MRFYEYESKALFAKRRLPMGKGRVATSADEARAIAEEIGGPVVLKSQVLSGGRMKAGAVKFADTPGECPALFEQILPIEVNGQKARSVLVEEKSPIEQEYFVSVTWDGRRKLPVLLFSDMGGIDIEEVAEKHPEHVSKTWFSSILPISPRIAKEAISATGVSGSQLNRLTRTGASSCSTATWTWRPRPEVATRRSWRSWASGRTRRGRPASRPTSRSPDAR
jgi:succinyl-CoA synthetase beta subunit